MLKFTKLVLATIFYSTVFIFLSCETSNEQKTFFESEDTDSMALRIAILPIEECEILQYAHESGLASNMGLSMELVPYNALMDIDTAILSNVAHVYFEDSLRVDRIKDSTIRPALLLHIPVRMSLIANKDKDIDTIPELRTNMVGLTRWSQSETWMNEITCSSGLEQTDIYHAQINSIPVRFEMVHEGLIDAAILPQPWADSLKQCGHITLKDTILHNMGLFINPEAQSDTFRMKQAKLLKEVYLEAMKTLNR